MAFVGMLCLLIYHGLLLEFWAFTKNLRKPGTWLFGASLWKIINALWLVKYSSKFLLLTREAWIVNVQGCGMRWYLSWLARYTKYTDSVYRVGDIYFWKFAEISRKVSISENQILLKYWYSQVSFTLFINRKFTR